MPNEHEKILKYNQGEKSLKVLFMIYADLECLLRKIDSCQIKMIQKNLLQKKELSMSLLVTHGLHAVNLMNQKTNGVITDCMEMFCNDLRGQAIKIITMKRKMILLTDKETESYEKQKVCYICEKEFSTDKNDKNAFKLYHKVRDHCHYTGKFRGAAHNICNLRYKIPKEIPTVFHNGSTYDYHFIFKLLAIEFKGEFECLGRKTKKYITFSVPIKKNMIMVKQLHTN